MSYYVQRSETRACAGSVNVTLLSSLIVAHLINKAREGQQVAQGHHADARQSPSDCSSHSSFLCITQQALGASLRTPCSGESQALLSRVGRALDSSLGLSPSSVLTLTWGCGGCLTSVSKEGNHTSTSIHSSARDNEPAHGCFLRAPGQRPAWRVAPLILCHCTLARLLQGTHVLDETALPPPQLSLPCAPRLAVSIPADRNSFLGVWSDTQEPCVSQVPAIRAP